MYMYNQIVARGIVGFFFKIDPIYTHVDISPQDHFSFSKMDWSSNELAKFAQEHISFTHSFINNNYNVINKYK